jgi:hypothetical protein
VATDPALPIQGALVAAIKAIPTVAGNNVYDAVPASNPFPRVTLGPGQGVPVLADCYDGTETTVQIDCWSRQTGYPEVKTIADQIRGRLHDGDLSITGHTCELMVVEMSDYSRDPDGLTSRARLVVRIQSQPNP